MNLTSIADFIRKHPAVIEKAVIRNAYNAAKPVAHDIPLGDDAAAIPSEDGWLIFAGEAMLAEFVADDPWFAGYCAVMVNISDVAAMGGRPTALVDLLWKSDEATANKLWEGMRAASQKYGVPIVGGHTSEQTNTTHLGATILGKAKRLLTSFDAEPGDELLMAVDMRAAYRKDKPFWNASVEANAEQLQGDIELLPKIAEAGLAKAAKDISNGGIFGTLIMLLECSQVGAHVDLDTLPRPKDNDLERWLIAFPSFGYLIAAKPKNVAAIKKLFDERSITCASIGHFQKEQVLQISHQKEVATIWRDGKISI